MTTAKEGKVTAIRKRLEEYHRHKNDSYSFFPEEIDAVRGLKDKAPEDIKFLLALLDQKPKTTKKGAKAVRKKSKKK